MEASFLQFSATAQHLSGRAQGLGLAVPAFRTPPRLTGADRTLRRHHDGTAIVSVRVRGRSQPEIFADLVEGILVVNRLAGEEAAGARRALLEAEEIGGRPVAGLGGDSAFRAASAELPNAIAFPIPV